MNKPICPYLSTNGNKCSHKRMPSDCINSKNQNKCPYYNEWDKNRIIDSRAVSDDLRAIEELISGT